MIMGNSEAHCSKVFLANFKPHRAWLNLNQAMSVAYADFYIAQFINGWPAFCKII